LRGEIVQHDIYSGREAFQLSSFIEPSPRSLRLSLDFFKVAVQSAAAGGMLNEPLVAQALPQAEVQSGLGCILLAGANSRGVTAPGLGSRHVRIEECAAVRGMLMDHALPSEQPVAMAVRLPGRDQHRIRLVESGPQMLLGPGEQVSVVGAELVKIGDIQAAGNVPARNAAALAAAARAGETMQFSFRRFGQI
jgi:hypothetical protein